AEQQLAHAAAHGRERGMAVGLYLDLAVSVDRAGADTWSHASTYALTASVGAPPDAFNQQGQAWGLPPLRPDRLRVGGYRAFIDTLVANMRLAGALRIDHVMGLMRLFWIPAGRGARDGAYVHYRVDELLAIVVLESHRHRCLVIGEDLGTVLDEMRAALRERGVLSYRLLYFERDAEGGFKAPDDYPRDALVAVATHDLPTLAGWWQGRDIDLRRDLGLFADPDGEAAQRAERAQDRQRLLAVLASDAAAPEAEAGRGDDRARPGRAAGAAAGGGAGGRSGADLALGRPVFDAAAPMTAPLAEAIHRHLAATPSVVMMVQLEDALGMVEEANLPGTTDQQPNWRRKLVADLDAIGASVRVDSLCAAIRSRRPTPAAQSAPVASVADVVEVVEVAQVARVAQAAEVGQVIPGPPAAPAVQAATVAPATASPSPPDGITVAPRIPRATYRLHLHGGFDFDAAARVLPYLVRLGVSHVYCSPISRAAPGSLHGYDVVAHDEINPELGGAAGLARFVAALREHGLGLLLDLVPNHMGTGAENAWWADVLENGEASLLAHYFDIDWHPLDADLDGKVLLPVLGDAYGDVLDRGELGIDFDAARGSFAVAYHEHRFAIDVRDYATLLRLLEIDDAALRDAVTTLAAAFAGLPSRHALGDASVDRRARDKVALKERLARLASEHPALRAAIERALAEAGAPERLHDLLEGQAWRLASWRVASDEINYRRFFDVNSLAALRIERRPVFEATQGLALELTATGVADGLRIDHPDGLRDPARYFLRLQQGHAERAGLVVAEPPGGRPARPLYLLAEKIAALDETIPGSWAVHGTTGYRFASLVNGLFVDTAAEARLDRIWRAFSGDPRSFDEHAYTGKRDVMRSGLASELTVLASELLRIARADRRSRDHTFNSLRDALAEITACLAVYRTYIVDAASTQDRRYVDQAVSRARHRSPAADAAVFDFVRRTMLGEAGDGATAALRERALHWAVRFQQFSAPVAAKGVEDTADYRYLRLASLNEVGGDPARFGTTVREFHRASADRAAHRPHTLIATSTHDHKRSADVRCRIDVLSEMPAGWRLLLRRWSRLNRRHKTRLDDGGWAPSPRDENLLYQTLLGTLPPAPLDAPARARYRERIQA
ncbi:MAG TPA: malto-oligosyltrehalose synthase, partial [Caldimonas sp.]|nr:malto-oligosyltrehalose synthase [Caldimonas sp.]